jgi:hypothetical protein
MISDQKKAVRCYTVIHSPGTCLTQGEDNAIDAYNRGVDKGTRLIDAAVIWYVDIPKLVTRGDALSSQL